MKKFLTIAIACLTISATIVNGQSTAQKNIENKIADAVLLYENGNTIDARNTLRSITSAAQGNDAAFYYLGLCNADLGDIESAIANFKKASELDPGNFWYKQRLATVYAATKNEELAQNTYENLLKDYPKKNEIYYSLCDLYIQQGQYDNALSTLDSIDVVFGKSEAAATTRYQIYMAQQKPTEAVNALKDYNKDYSSPSILARLGDYEMSEYKDTAALRYYDEALSLAQDYAPALLGKAEVFRTQRNYESFFSTLRTFVGNEEIAIVPKCQYLSALLQRSPNSFLKTFRSDIDSVVEQCVSTAPTDSSALQMAGLYYYSTERQDKAEDYLKTAVEKNPTSGSAAATYVQMLVYSGKWQEAVKECDKASAEFPNETGFLELKTIACYNLKDYNSIISNCEKIITIARTDTSRTLPAFSTMGDVYHEIGETKKAYKAYETALKINPNYAPVLNNYAYYLSEEGRNLKTALKMSKKTADLEPDNPTYLDTYGWILHLMGNDAEAKPVFKHAMLYGGKESVVIMDHYAEVLYALGEYDLAKVYWNQAKAKNNGKITDLDERVSRRLKKIK